MPHVAAVDLYRKTYGADPKVVAFAPGRIEVLGNHTDYNEGLVLSAAISEGTCFAAGRAQSSACRIVSADFDGAADFEVIDPQPGEPRWANYCKGVLAYLRTHGVIPRGFNAAVASTVPDGAGLSSSAALEVSTALALVGLYGIEVPRLELAKLCREAEQNFAGLNCGLLDQITSLYGEEGCLVRTDFRSLDIVPIPFSPDLSFLVCDTGVKHSLVDSAYNDRRERCEAAAEFFDGVLGHPVTALRDVSMGDWETRRTGLDADTARRAAHVIGENERVEDGCRALAAGHHEVFGAMMFASHESSRTQFENSCPELDFIVDHAATRPGVLGARLSGGGFGGSAIILLRADAADDVAAAVKQAYDEHTGGDCHIRTVRPAAGARLLPQTTS